MKFYQYIASVFDAYLRCMEKANTTSDKKDSDWADAHRKAIELAVTKHAPSGSGFDRDTLFDFERSWPEKLVFTTDFHHMNDSGYYVGWSEHTVVVKPSLVSGFILKATGRNVRDIKPFIEDVFYNLGDVEV